MDLKVGDKAIAPATTSNSEASYSSSFQDEVIEIEDMRAHVQRCLSKQRRTMYAQAALHTSPLVLYFDHLILKA